MLTINEIKQFEPDTYVDTPTVKAVVLDVSEFETDPYSKKGKFFAVLADETGSISATIYNEKEHLKCMKGFGVIVRKVLLKQSYIGITTKTEVALCQPFSIPEEVKETAAKLPGAETNTLDTALKSPVKSIISVKGKIVSVSPSSTKRLTNSDKELQFQEIQLKDETGKLKVAIWDKMVDTLSIGQQIKLSKCRVKLFQDEKKLSTTNWSECEVFTHDADLEDVSSEEEEIQSDEAAPLKDLNSGVIIGIMEVDLYFSCPKVSCNNKKMVTLKEKDLELYFMFCNACQCRYKTNSCNTYLSAVLLLQA
ncbi:hypothetical protein KUTeg_018650, partial [Tegillarca granosa]